MIVSHKLLLKFRSIPLSLCMEWNCGKVTNSFEHAVQILSGFFAVIFSGTQGQNPEATLCSDPEKNCL